MPRARIDRAALRTPLHARRRVRREADRRRIATRTRQPLTAEQRAFDPLGRSRRSAGRKLGYALAAILGSLAVHGAVVGIGVIWRAQADKDRARDEVTIKVLQRPPEPPPEKKPPEPPPPVEKPTRAPPKIAKAPPPPVVEPPRPAKAPPLRVVGLNLESTTEGGSGPAFAVGNTRRGETAERAVAPKDLRAAPAEAAPVAAVHSIAGNQIASRIPVAGVKYTMPKRRHPKEPPFPETLKSQGIEGDVTVLVSLDTTGKVTSVKLIKESTYPEFNEAARAAALAEEFEPATRDGDPMPFTLSFTYRFRLEDK